MFPYSWYILISARFKIKYKIVHVHKRIVLCEESCAYLELFLIIIFNKIYSIRIIGHSIYPNLKYMYLRKSLRLMNLS